MIPRLTKSVVERIKPNLKQDILVWDSSLPGFGLRVYPSGKRMYIVQYRAKDNRQRRLVIGQHGGKTITHVAARLAFFGILALF